ncbi:MAG: pentapeptide repeat-containing protein [Pseudomonadota bacterium]
MALHVPDTEMNWTFTELKKHLAAHQEWVASRGVTGKHLALTGVVLERANFGGLALDGTDCSQARFRRCRFADAQFNTCRFSDSELIDCDLGTTELVDAIFMRARLLRCDLSTANLRGTVWFDAKLADVDFSRALFDGAQFDGCTFDNIRWPTPPISGLALKNCRGSLP